ncbi:MAG: hypothetical protein ACRDSZ_22990 [Pseudonocardiaceae bacterium]
MTGAPVEPLVVGAVVLVALAGVVLVALAGVGVVAAFGAGVRAAHRATQHARAVTRIGANLTRAVVTGAVIVGVQWAGASPHHRPHRVGSWRWACPRCSPVPRSPACSP